MPDIGHRQERYDEVLSKVVEARGWLKSIGIETSNTRLSMIEGTLRQFLSDSESKTKNEVIARWDWAERQDAYYALTDGRAFWSITRALSSLASHRLPRRALTTVLRGPLCPTDEKPDSTQARNVFLELDLAAMLINSGIEVTDWDDVQFRFDKASYLVECKRPFSAKSVASNVKRAWEQLNGKLKEKNCQRGIIAIAVDKILKLDSTRPIPIQDGKHLYQWLDDTQRTFQDTHGHTWQEIGDARLVAVVIVFRLLCHSLPPINTISIVPSETLISLCSPESREGKRLKSLYDRLQL